MTELERRRLVVLNFITTALDDDVEGFTRNTVNIDWPGAWLEIFTALAPMPRELVSDSIRRAFKHSWRGHADEHPLEVVSLNAPIGAHWTLTKDLNEHIELLVNAMKVLMPQDEEFDAPNVLYRGQSLAEHQRYSHGVWWTPDPMYAEMLARSDHRSHVGQGAVLATLVPRRAIIYKLNMSEFLIDPGKLGPVWCIDVPPRYTQAESDLDLAGRDALSRMLHVPWSYDHAEVYDWLKMQGIADKQAA